MRKNVIHAALGALGLALLVWMVQKIGIDVLLGNLKAFGFTNTLALIAVYTLAQIAFCAAWHVILVTYQRSIRFRDTFRAYAAGDALNMTVPSANLAGEPVKVLLMRDKIAAEPAIASVTVYKFADFISLTLFLLFGWIFQFFFFSLPAAWNAGGGVIAAGMAAGCFLFYALQKKGVYHPAGKFLQKIGLGHWVIHKLESAHFIDHSIREFYIHHPVKFWEGVFYNFLAWFGGVAEIMLFMKLTGAEASFAAALTIETFSLFINNVTFFVPARIGVGEGGRVLLFAALGYPTALGLSYGIIRRIRELAWVAIGLIILLLAKRNQYSRDPASADSLNKNSISPI